LLKFIKWGSKEQKETILKAFYGHVTKLAKHKDAAPVLEKLYAEYASKQQRAALVEEFYGAEYALFKVLLELSDPATPVLHCDANASLSKLAQSDKIRTLDDILAEHPEKKAIVHRYLKDNVLAVLNKAEKSTLLSHSILHPVLLSYMKLIDNKERAEFISSLSEHLLRVIHTKEGSQVGWQCVSFGSAKVRCLCQFPRCSLLPNYAGLDFHEGVGTKRHRSFFSLLQVFLRFA
jgi:pumilio family protein 6